jgi:hypothetical protein
MNENTLGADAPTPEEIKDVLAEPQADLPEIELFQTDEERKIALRMLPVLQMKAIAAAKITAEADKAREMKDFVDKLIAENQEILKKKIDEIQKSMTPPTSEELQKLLSQEYVEFTLKLRCDGKEREFVLRELPMAAETRLLKMVQKTLASRIKEIGAIDWRGEVGSNTLVERIVKIMELVPGAIETMSACCAVCLDPLGEDPKITGDWVQNNLSLGRLASIIQAQLEVGRYRDFFSRVSKVIPGLMTT